MSVVVSSTGFYSPSDADRRHTTVGHTIVAKRSTFNALNFSYICLSDPLRSSASVFYLACSVSHVAANVNLLKTMSHNLTLQRLISCNSREPSMAWKIFHLEDDRYFL